MTGIVDGDTIDVRQDGTVERVRIIGIDTPERGQCGFRDATDALDDLIDGRQVALIPGARTDRDAYDRILRYVDVDGTDAGLRLLEQGLAVARYDSRDGYGRHPREDLYVTVDAGTGHVCGITSPAAGPGPGPAGDSGDQPVKLSTSGICHPPGSTFYDRTTNFVPYGTVDECLDAGGRLPRQ